ncbi:ASCH domain-containing protein [Acidovorax sp. LjRoot118]|uniref:ASCH domain-containing protein n=1 Tax=Acidovorax sp. LjRoot118 TaxID=3342256 RepID=UPI003ECC4F1C
MIPALSIRQPWAWLIVNGFKDIENRDWPTNFRGEMLVHASQTMTRRYYDGTVEVLQMLGLYPPSLPTYESLERGGLVGWTRVVDCVEHHPSPWKMDGGHGFVLRDSRPIPFVPYKGRLGFFNVPQEALQA